MNENIESWTGFFSYKPTKVLQWLLNSPCKITCLYTGNQFGKNECATMDFCLSILGWHPNKNKNMNPDDSIRTFRFASQTLPGEKEGDEVRNTQYPAFKRRFPLSLVEKDITARKPVISVKTPNGANVNVEFVSFSQDTQAMAGVQRKRIWIDEECSKIEVPNPVESNCILCNRPIFKNVMSALNIGSESSNNNSEFNSNSKHKEKSKQSQRDE